MTFETKSCHCGFNRRAEVQFNSISAVRHGSNTTFETGLSFAIVFTGTFTAISCYSPISCSF